MRALREATKQEILDAYRRLSRPLVRHFIRETYHAKSRTGAAHREHSRTTLRVEGERLTVQLFGKREEVTATLYALDDSKTFVADLRIKSDHLAPLHKAAA